MFLKNLSRPSSLFFRLSLTWCLVQFYSLNQQLYKSGFQIFSFPCFLSQVSLSCLQLYLKQLDLAIPSAPKTLLLWCRYLPCASTCLTLIITALVQMLMAFCLGPGKGSLVASNFTLLQFIPCPTAYCIFQEYNPRLISPFQKLPVPLHPAE